MSLEQTIDNLQIRNANMVTFVGTSNTMVDTTTGRIQTKGIQHNSNVITDVSGPHGRGVATLKKYPEIAFESGKFDSNPTTNTFIQAGYTFIPSSSLNPTDWPGDELFDGHIGVGSGWLSEASYHVTPLGSAPTLPNATPTAPAGEYITIKMPKKIKLSHMRIAPLQGTYTTRAPTAGKIYGGLDGTNWTEIGSFSGFTYSTNQYNKINGTSTAYYSHFALVATAITNTTNGTWMGIGEWELYGYEEDPPAGDHSVDTTFKSRFNNAQTTGVQVLVDGATGVGTNQISGGPDPSGNQSTYVTDGKYWTLNGTLTSNLSVEANTFLEGDQPHAVSVWFNSSNLEANVSNTCVFSIASEEKLDSVNLDLQSNTWHNLTYTYQGEGGSRVTYLDGRKVAEDQAEDTFGDYPPFAMTGYSQGGYVVSSNFENTTEARKPYNAFNAVGTGNRWQVDSGYSTSSPFLAVAVNGLLPSITDTNGTAHVGHWLKLELPHKLRLNRFTTTNYIHSQYHLKSYVILGSNDDVNWTLLHSEADANLAGGVSGGTHDTGISGVTESFKYLKLLVKSKANGTSATLMVQQVIFYGHRENDLVRLPDPTNVLKYPHIAMTGPAQRGYVAKVSSVLSSSYNAFSPFNGDSGVGNTLWISESGGDHTYTSGSGNGQYTGNVRTVSVPVSGTGTENLDGEYVELELPHKIKLTDVGFQREYYQPNDIYGPSRMPAEGSISASNDGVTWYTIHSWTGLVPGDVSHTGDGYVQTLNGGTNFGTINTSSPNYGAYKYYRFIWQRLYRVGISGADNPGIAGCDEIEYYGTGVDSIPIQIGGGNIDKVANFRVYDKFVGEDQVNEIWNAQKEEFGRAKPQMVLQQGKLGIGTDAPQGSLSVADEPDPDAYGLQRIPPKPASGYDTHIEGYGMFQVSTSNAGGGTAAAYWAFDHDIDRNNHSWRNDGTPYTSGTWNSTQTASTTENSNTHVGHWIQLYTPVKYSLKSHKVSARAVATYRQPYSAVVLGSTDGSTWNLLDTWTTIDVTRVKRSITIDNTTLYNYFRLVVKALENHGDAVRVDLGEWELYGIREQLPPKQSILHDGQLTLTKSLNVPRIGPPLDADDTPRRDRLVVEYNTSTNPTFDGAVRDTSGRGLDGAFYGGASYDANDKALVFDGTTDYIMGHLGNAGDTDFTVSLWLKKNTSGTVGMLWNFGGSGGSGNPEDSVALEVGSSNSLDFFIFSGAQGAISNFGTTYLGKWVHVVATRSGNNLKIYLDGVDQNMSISGTDTLQLARNSEFTIGARGTGALGNNSLNGSISNFKIYDVVLTAQEVKTLYDMGRCDEGHHVVNFSKTRVGIGLGDGEAPRGALDVRGGVAGPFHTFLTGDYTSTSSSPTSSAYSPLASYTFDVPKEYNSYGNANLEVFGQVKWSGEGPDPWNTNFSLRLYYGSGLTSYIGSAQVSGGSNSKGCGMIAISHHADNNSTLDSAVASSKFLIPNCPVSPGSQLKLEILHSQGAGSGTIYTNRTTNAITTDYNYERGTTNFFMALKVV